MRVGLVTTSYPRRPGEAAGGFVAAHAAALRALGHGVEVIAAGEAGAATPPSAEPEVTRVPARGLFYDGGAPEALERGDARAWLEAATFSARLAATVARRAARWDLIVAHWLAPAALAALPARAPLLAIAHGGDVHVLRRARLLGPALHLLRARRARVAFVSGELQAIARRAAGAALARWLDAASIVQPMGVDLAHFAALGRAPTRPPTIAVIARLVPIKGVDTAIAGFAQLRVPARLVIAGDGPERARLEHAARALAPSLHGAGAPRGDAPAPGEAAVGVRFLGELDAAARDRLLREASVVVVASRRLAGGAREGTPLVALEALAVGVPVVASAIGGLTALPAVHVPPDDPPALAAAIERVLAAPPRVAAPAELDWPRVAKRLHAFALGSCEAGDPSQRRGA